MSLPSPHPRLAQRFQNSDGLCVGDRVEVVYLSGAPRYLDDSRSVVQVGHTGRVLAIKTVNSVDFQHDDGRVCPGLLCNRLAPCPEDDFVAQLARTLTTP